MLKKITNVLHLICCVRPFLEGSPGIRCGALSADGVVKLEIDQGEYDTYGVRACDAVLSVASNMEHIQKSGMDLDPRLAFHCQTRPELKRL